MPTLAQLADALDLDYRGDGDLQLNRVASLASAGAGALSFYADARLKRALAETRATAVIIAPAQRHRCPCAAVLSDAPYADFVRAVRLLRPEPESPAGIDPHASVAPDAVIHPSAWVGPRSVVEAGARIAAGAQIGPGCLVGRDAVIGEDARLVAGVTLLHNVVLGRRVLVHPGAVIGADGFGLLRERSGWTKVPQLGGVRIGDDVEIGANTTIDRGTLDDTVIGRGVKIDNQVQIAHNVVIGDHTAIAGCVGICGGVRIGAWCTLAGGVGVVGHVEIADQVQVTVMSRVTHSLRRPGVYSSGTPIMANADWRRNAVHFKRLDQRSRRGRRGDDK